MPKVTSSPLLSSFPLPPPPSGSLTNVVFLSLVSSLHQYTFLLFAAILLAAAAYVAAYLPETKGRTLQEIQDLMAGGAVGRGGRGGAGGGGAEAQLPLSSRQG